jgi:hypothetical protein
VLDTPQSCGNARRLNHDRHQCSRGERLFARRAGGPQSVLPGADTPGRASQVFTLYAAAGTIPLALFALVAIHRQSAKALLVLGALAGVVQLLDAGVGAFQGDVAKTLGPLMIAALQFVSVFFLARTIGADAPERGRGL